VRRLLLFLTAALVLAAPAVAVNPKFWITAITIGDANLHWSKQQYKSHWGKPVRFDRLENGYTRLTFSKRHIEVYFKQGHTGAIAIVTWDKRDRTLDKIGPCSTVTAFKQAYPKAGKFKQNGKVVAYRLGRLIFTAETSKIGDVMLATPAVSPYVALNAAECGVP
jgi:hypothetical protein